MSEQKSWFSWVIRKNRYENVIGHIRENVVEVDKYFYPMIKKEYQSKKGVIIKDRPLYEGYLFLRYHNHNVVFHKLSICPFITTYAGTVKMNEIEAMENVQGKLITEIKASKYRKGDPVTILGGPLKNLDAKVLSVSMDKVKVRIDAKILGQNEIDIVFAENQIQRKSKLYNSGIRTI